MMLQMITSIQLIETCFLLVTILALTGIFLKIRSFKSVRNLFPHLQKSTPPWWSKSTSRTIQKKRSLYFKYQATKSKIDYHNYATQCNLVKARVHSAQIIYEEQLIKFKTNPKALLIMPTSKLNRKLRILLVT